MKEFLDLRHLSKNLILLAYFIFLTLAVVLAIWIIAMGLNDPFGTIYIIIGMVALIVLPIIIKIAFSLIFSKFNLDENK